MDDDFLGGSSGAQDSGFPAGGDEFSPEAGQSGFVFMASDAPATSPAGSASPAAATFPGAGAGAAATERSPVSFAAPAGGATFGADDVNPLVEFNKRFREVCESKDAAEREAKGVRRTAGKAALKALLAERNKAVDSRKTKNREEETAKERELLESMSGEPWTRVFSMVDVHGSPAAAGSGGAGASSPAEGGGAGGGGKKKAAATGEGVGDLGRMKDVLIAVKNAPPPTTPGVAGM